MITSENYRYISIKGKKGSSKQDEDKENAKDEKDLSRISFFM
jgi:hypothetical protein